MSAAGIAMIVSGGRTGPAKCTVTVIRTSLKRDALSLPGRRRDGDIFEAKFSTADGEGRDRPVRARD